MKIKKIGNLYIQNRNEFDNIIELLAKEYHVDTLNNSSNGEAHIFVKK